MNLRHVSITLLGMLLAGCAGNEPSLHSISEPNRVGTDRYPVVRAATGSRVELTRRDGTVLRGNYLGMGRMSVEAYAHHWTEVLGSIPADSTSFPAPGTLLSVRTRSGRERDLRFAGFGFRSLEVGDSADRIESIPFDVLDQVRVEGKRWSHSDLADAADSRRLPMTSIVRLRVGAGEIVIPSDQIVSAEDRSGHEVATVALITLLVATTVALAAYFANPFAHVTW